MSDKSDNTALTECLCGCRYTSHHHQITKLSQLFKIILWHILWPYLSVSVTLWHHNKIGSILSVELQYCWCSNVSFVWGGGGGEERREIIWVLLDVASTSRYAVRLVINHSLCILCSLAFSNLLSCLVCGYEGWTNLKLRASQSSQNIKFK